MALHGTIVLVKDKGNCALNNDANFANGEGASSLADPLDLFVDVMKQLEAGPNLKLYPQCKALMSDCIVKLQASEAQWQAGQIAVANVLA